MNPNSSTATSTVPQNGSDDVSRRAYELWEKEGRPEGCDLRHWLQAEQECGITRADQGMGGAPTASTQTNTGAHDRPLQTTRTTGASKRGSNAPFGNEKQAAGNGTAQGAGKRRSASSPAM